MDGARTCTRLTQEERVRMGMLAGLAAAAYAHLPPDVAGRCPEVTGRISTDPEPRGAAAVGRRPAGLAAWPPVAQQWGGGGTGPSGRVAQQAWSTHDVPPRQ